MMYMQFDQLIFDKIIDIMGKYKSSVKKFMDIDYKSRINNYDNQILNNNIKIC